MLSIGGQNIEMVIIQGVLWGYYRGEVNIMQSWGVKEKGGYIERGSYIDIE